MKQSVPSAQPDYVTALQAAYGAPSQSGFGSAVFYEALAADKDLELAALAKYRFFVGDLWERFGYQAWLGQWTLIYTRQPETTVGVIAELRRLTDQAAQLSVPMILDAVQDAEQAHAALSAAFDDPAVTELAIYNIGDGAAMAGLLIATRRGAAGEATFLVFLMD